MTIIAAADGSALGNPGPAGWAWYVDDACWDAGGWPHATNNQGELKAVLELFRATEHVEEDLLVLCDSQYVINAVTKWMDGWKRKGWRKADGSPVMNVDLLMELDEALKGRNFEFQWVRGHVGHELNEAADARARAVAEAYRRGSPIPSGPGFRAPDSGASRPPAKTGMSGTSSAGVAEGAASASSLMTDTVPAPDDFVVSGDDDALFSFESETWHPFTVTLSAAEHERLLRRARDAGVTPEDLLRGLI